SVEGSNSGVRLLRSEGASVSQSDSDSDAIAQTSASRQARGNGTANAVPTAMSAASNQLVRRTAMGLGVSSTKSSRVKAYATGQTNSRVRKSAGEPEQVPATAILPLHLSPTRS